MVTGQNFVIISLIIMKTLNHEQNITRIIDNTTKKLFKSKGFYLFKLILEWPNIIEKDYIEYCAPVSIKSLAANKKILEMEIYNSAIVFDLQYGKESIIESINGFFHQEIVNDIKFKLVEIAAKEFEVEENVPVVANKQISAELERDILEIDDEEIQNNLLRIARLKS